MFPLFCFLMLPFICFVQSCGFLPQTRRRRGLAFFNFPTGELLIFTKKQTLCFRFFAFSCCLLFVLYKAVVFNRKRAGGEVAGKTTGLHKTKGA